MNIQQREVKFITENYRADFEISMNNYSLYLETGLESTSVLRSNYSREIYEIPISGVGYAKYCLMDTQYKANGETEFRKWSFAKDADFYNCLFCLQDKDLKDDYCRGGLRDSPIPNLTDSFSKFPKLPSVYLLVMQAIDIITFDAFMCMANSDLYQVVFSTDYQSVDEMVQRHIGIGAGVYSKKSYYLNDRLYVRLAGETLYKGEECWIVDYSSEPSDIYVEHSKIRTARKSKSLYSGCIYLSKKDGDILYGELDEDIISMGKKREYSKRNVILKRL